MLETIETNNQQVIAFTRTQNSALLYTGYPFIPNGQLHEWDQQMEPEIRAPEYKLQLYLLPHTKSKIENPVKEN